MLISESYNKFGYFEKQIEKTKKVKAEEIHNYFESATETETTRIGFDLVLTIIGISHTLSQ